MLWLHGQQGLCLEHRAGWRLGSRTLQLCMTHLSVGACCPAQSQGSFYDLGALGTESRVTKPFQAGGVQTRSHVHSSSAPPSREITPSEPPLPGRTNALLQTQTASKPEASHTGAQAWQLATVSVQELGRSLILLTLSDWEERTRLSAPSFRP